MKKNTLKLLCLLAAFGIFCTMCSDPIDIAVPEAAPMLVVNSLFTNDSVMTVFVHKTTTMQQQTNNYVENAKIILSDELGHTEILQHVDTGCYKSVRRLQPSVLYAIEVQVDGFPTAYASDSIPQAVPIKSGRFTYRNYWEEQEQSMLSTINVCFEDPQQIKNYYEITAITIDSLYYYYPEKISDWDTPTITGEMIRNIYTNELSILAENNHKYPDYNRGYFVFSDNLLNAEADIDFYATFAVNTKSDTEYSFVVLRNISYQYYLHKRSWIRHKYNQSLVGYSGIEDLTNMFFTGNPVEMYSNIENGLGIFAGYSTSLYPLK